MVEKLCDIEELHETEKLLAELGNQNNKVKDGVKVKKADQTIFTKEIKAEK